MSGAEFIVAFIICVLFGSTCYWLGYGYGKDEGFDAGKADQKERYIKTLDAYRVNLQGCQETVGYQSLAIDTMKQNQPTKLRSLTGSQVIDLARHRGKGC